MGKMPEECGSDMAWSVCLDLRSSRVCLLSGVKQALMLHGETEGGGRRRGEPLVFKQRYSLSVPEESTAQPASGPWWFCDGGGIEQGPSGPALSREG